MAVSGRERETSREGFWQDGATFYSLLREYIYIKELLSLHNVQYINSLTVSVMILSHPVHGYPMIQPALFSRYGFCVTFVSTTNYKSRQSSGNIFWKRAQCCGVLPHSKTLSFM